MADNAYTPSQELVRNYLRQEFSYLDRRRPKAMPARAYLEALWYRLICDKIADGVSSDSDLLACLKENDCGGISEPEMRIVLLVYSAINSTAWLNPDQMVFVDYLFENIFEAAKQRKLTEFTTEENALILQIATYINSCKAERKTSAPSGRRQPSGRRHVLSRAEDVTS